MTHSAATIVKRRFGAEPSLDGTVFRLWAPSVEAADLLRPMAPSMAMHPAGDGFFEVAAPGVVAGERYRFRAGGLDFADPASRGQEKDADGWSIVPAPLPPGSGKAIRPWHEAVVAEIHVGAATPEGSFKALAEKLGHFADAGYTAIEIMPVADFVGRWNWGYDGVLPFAPDRSYGTPEELRALVDAAHGLGLGVVIDVVYNHFGPAGNYLSHYAKAFFAESEKTPWGPAIALDNPIVRDFFRANTRMWLEDYDMDGLRFDAVHAFRTEGAPTLLVELAETARRIKPDAWLILENDDNGARWLERLGDGRPRHFTAQWNDDYHHVFTVAAGGDATAHFRDYAEDTIGLAARALAEGFVYQGEAGPHRGMPRGEPSGHLPPDAFVAFVQNHDQIGNRPMGDRLVERFADARVRCLRFVVGLGPSAPLFFMGEEAGLDAPFPFFCDFDGDLGDAVRRGRHAEFKPFFETHDGTADDLPDPLTEATFVSAKLDWDRMGQGPELAAFRSMLALRRRLVWPLTATAYRGSSVIRDGDASAVTWRFDAGALTLALNLSDAPGAIVAPDRPPDAEIGIVGRHGAKVRLGPWSAALFSEAGR